SHICIQSSRALRSLHSFPTRRSSDLKANPGKLNYATVGVGSAAHFGAEQLAVSAGFSAQHVPFKGGEWLTEVIAGRLDFAEVGRSEEHTSELQSLTNLVCRLLLEKKN